MIRSVVKLLNSDEFNFIFRKRHQIWQSYLSFSLTYRQKSQGWCHTPPGGWLRIKSFSAQATWSCQTHNQRLYEHLARYRKFTTLIEFYTTSNHSNQIWSIFSGRYRRSALSSAASALQLILNSPSFDIRRFYDGDLGSS